MNSDHTTTSLLAPARKPVVVMFAMHAYRKLTRTVERGECDNLRDLLEQVVARQPHLVFEWLYSWVIKSLTPAQQALHRTAAPETQTPDHAMRSGIHLAFDWFLLDCRLKRAEATSLVMQAARAVRVIKAREAREAARAAQLLQ